MIQLKRRMIKNFEGNKFFDAIKIRKKYEHLSNEISRLSLNSNIKAYKKETRIIINI